MAVPADTAGASSRGAAGPVTGQPPTPPAPPAWDAAAGPVMLVRGDASASAYVVFPQYSDSSLPDTVGFDLTAVRNADVELYGHAGGVGSARVASVAGRPWHVGRCMEWPAASLALAGDSTAAGWSVAFLPGRLAPVALDSIESMAPLDSARLAADITRLVSALPIDPADVFRGIPFSVRNAYLFTSAAGVAAIAADVVRNLNQEAMPLEEHTFLVAERRGADRRYDVVYHDRSAGTEEALVTTEVLAAVRFPSPERIALVLLREGFETNAYALLERSPDARWRVRWTSVRTGC